MEKIKVGVVGATGYAGSEICRLIMGHPQAELAAITLTSGLKNIGQSLIWFFDEWDAGTTYWGQSVLLGLNEGGVGIVTDKNYATIAPQAVQDTTNAAIEAVANGEVTVPTAIGDETGALEELRESVRP